MHVLSGICLYKNWRGHLNSEIKYILIHIAQESGDLMTKMKVSLRALNYTPNNPQTLFLYYNPSLFSQTVLYVPLQLLPDAYIVQKHVKGLSVKLFYSLIN